VTLGEKDMKKAFKDMPVICPGNEKWLRENREWEAVIKLRKEQEWLRENREWLS
jgi:hypothetical protein